MASKWVRTEIAKARKREERDKRRVLFPVRLVSFKNLGEWECFDADIGIDSAKEIREYFIPDFSNWKDHDQYQKAFDRLLGDLKTESRRRFRKAPFQPSMRSMTVIVMLKIDSLRLQIGCGPEYDAVEILATNRADQSLYEGVRKRHIRNSLDFGYLGNPKIGLPLVESIQRIMIRAEIFWQTVPANRAMEHPARGGTEQDVANILGISANVVRKHYAKWSHARQQRISRLFAAVYPGTFWVREGKGPVVN